MPYIQNTPEDIKQMLEKIGKKSIDDLYTTIPDALRLKEHLSLPEAVSEIELLETLKNIDAKNTSFARTASFLGAGAYNHFIPAVVEQVSSRNEFYTAYTPYQPEASQGILQTFFEYQTLICELTQMDISNASLYDGATSLAEAVIMAAANTKKKNVLLCSTIHPEYRQVTKTYLQNLDLKIFEAPYKNGITDLAQLEQLIDQKDPACVAFQQPNFFGCLEEAQEIEKLIHKKGGMLISIVDPISLGIINSPGAYNADIAVGEAQSLGNDLFFGGPYIGFIAARNELVRRIPGRLVGQTTDKKGRRSFTLTLQTREQHIRREKASSNICTNQGLCALRATLQLCALGKNGIKKVAELSCQKAHYLSDSILKMKKGFFLAFSSPFFKEFALKCPKPVSEINQTLLKNNILGGFDISNFYKNENNTMLLCVTEMITRKQMDNFCKVLC